MKKHIQFLVFTLLFGAMSPIHASRPFEVTPLDASILFGGAVLGAWAGNREVQHSIQKEKEEKEKLRKLYEGLVISLPRENNQLKASKSLLESEKKIFELVRNPESENQEHIDLFNSKIADLDQLIYQSKRELNKLQMLMIALESEQNPNMSAKKIRELSQKSNLYGQQFERTIEQLQVASKLKDILTTAKNKKALAANDARLLDQVIKITDAGLEGISVEIQKREQQLLVAHAFLNTDKNIQKSHEALINDEEAQRLRNGTLGGAVGGSIGSLLIVAMMKFCRNDASVVKEELHRKQIMRNHKEASKAIFSHVSTLESLEEQALATLGLSKSQIDPQKLQSTVQEVYKTNALSLHPDKNKGVSESQLTINAEKLQQIKGAKDAFFYIQSLNAASTATASTQGIFDVSKNSSIEKDGAMSPVVLTLTYAFNSICEEK